MIHYIPVGVQLIKHDFIEDYQGVIMKAENKVFVGPLLYLASIWQFGGTIDDYIEWRCAHYSRQIDKKYYLA